MDFDRGPNIGEEPHRPNIKTVTDKLPKVDVTPLVTSAIWKTMSARGRQSLRLVDENSRNAEALQDELIMRLLKDNAGTEYGREHGFADIHSPAEYKEKVPFSEFDDYAPYIERMLDNEENLITTYPIKH